MDYLLFTLALLAVFYLLEFIGWLFDKLFK